MRDFRPVVVVLVAALSVVTATFHGCGPECKPPCTGANICVNGVCTFDAGPPCVPACPSDQACSNGACQPNHPGIACPAPTVIAGGLIGPAVAPPVGSCSTLVKGSTRPVSEVTDLGVRNVGTDVVFTVPPNTGTFMLVSQRVSATESVEFNGNTVPNAVIPDQVFDPTNTKWFDDNITPPDPEQAFHRPFADAVVNAFTVPSTTKALSISRTGLPAGNWRFRVNDYAYECTYLPDCTDGGSTAGQYDLTLITKPIAPATAQLDVAVYLVANTGVNSTTAVSDVDMQRVVKTTNALFSQGGVCVSSVTYYDVPDWARTRYAAGIDGDEEGPCSGLSQLFTLSQGTAGVHLFFINQITGGGGGGSILGIDGLIPGPSSIPGTVGSGAVVSVDSLGTGTCTNSIRPDTCGDDQVAYVAAHEAGHWLGLFHSTESHGMSWDPLSDTPKCVCSTCAAPSQVSSCGDTVRMDHAMCGNLKPDCGGENNLMFWTIGSDAKDGIVSPQQGEIMRTNLAVH